MARATGANAILAGAFESTYGTPPGSGFRKLPFSSFNLGEEQNLIASDLLGYGREPLAPTLDVINNDGDVAVPVDLRNFGNWLKLFMGQPTTAASQAAGGNIAFAAQPAANSTITIAGTAWTFVTGAPAGNQTQLGANLAATLTQLATDLNASAVPAIAAATYASTGGTKLTIVNDALGTAGNSFALAASAQSNGKVSAATLTGGANSHVFTSGASVLPSMALECGLPEVPSYGMNYGVRGNTMRVALQRSGLLSASLGLIGKGESKAAASGAGTIAEGLVERFSPFQGSVMRNGVALGHVVSAEFTYSNNLDKVEVITGDGRIEDADPGMVDMSGNITVRFADTTLLDQATSALPCALQFGWTTDASRSLIFAIPTVYLPKPKTPVTGPAGIQATFAWRAAREPTSGHAVTATLINDVTAY